MILLRACAVGKARITHTVGDLLKMEKIEQRAVIKHLFKRGKTIEEIHKELVASFGTSAKSVRTIRRWIIDFRRGRTSIEDEHRPGAPRLVRTIENINVVKNLLEADRRLTVRQLANATGISYERVFTIIHEDLEMSKVSARWVPRLLTPVHKQKRLELSAQNLKLYEHDPDDFLSRFVTQDECWVYHYQPECEMQSKQWKHIASPTPRKAKLVPSAGKVMASVFWDSRGILMVDYLLTGKTITGNYYAELIVKLRAAIKEKRPGMLSKEVIFHQDNAPAHKSAVAMAAIAEAGFTVLDHPPYSPDLAPSDFHLFPTMKRALAGTKFQSNAAVIAAVESYFNEQPLDFYRAGIEALHHRWEKCVTVKGDYVEK